jgi:hypothetical protein
MFLHLEKISKKCRFFFWFDKMKEHYPEIRGKIQEQLKYRKNCTARLCLMGRTWMSV